MHFITGADKCFQRAQKLRECDGEVFYKADIVDAIVLEVVRKLFSRIKQEPHDRTIEQRLRLETLKKRSKKATLEKKICETKHALNVMKMKC